MNKSFRVLGITIFSFLLLTVSSIYAYKVSPEYNFPCKAKGCGVYFADTTLVPAKMTQTVKPSSGTIKGTATQFTSWINNYCSYLSFGGEQKRAYGVTTGMSRDITLTCSGYASVAFGYSHNGLNVYQHNKF